MSAEIDRNDWRLTAYALGELEGADLVAVEAFLERDPAARASVEGIAQTAGLLGSGLAAESLAQSSELTAEQRSVIENQALRAKPRKNSPMLSWRSLAGVAATALLLAGGWYGLERGGSKPGEGPEDRKYLEALVAQPSNPPQSLGYRVPGLDDEQIHRLSSLGYGGGGGGEAAAAAGALSGQGYMGADPIPRPAYNVRDRLHVLGYASGQTTWTRSSGTHRQTFRAFSTGGILGDSDSVQDTGESYAQVQENGFLSPGDAPLSTFAIDVDTASYANVRRFLQGGNLPPKDAVRIEELVNYFPYSYPAPTGADPFSVDVEVAAAPWKPEHRLVRIGLAGRPVSVAERKQSNLVFLIDVSGSMNGPGKLPLLVRSMSLLVENLDVRDTVGIVVYAGASGVALEPTSAQFPEAIFQALERLSAGGSTNGAAGIQLAYQLAARNFRKGGINRVILATDGDFNVGVSSETGLENLIEAKAKTGIFLTVLGFGMGNLQDSKMELLADKGNGNYAYIDGIQEARKVLVAQMGGTLDTIAKDVKIQVEFNPSQVAAYRLIGYENRLMAAQDFRDDSKDAGEIGAGHTVTALYEVVPAGAGLCVPGEQPLRYQDLPSPAPAGTSDELLTVSLRYMQPEGRAPAKELAYPIVDRGMNFHEASQDTRFAAAVAGFGMLLRNSAYRSGATFGDVRGWALEASSHDPGGYRAAFLKLVARAAEL